jgi:hypothetical protein
MDVSEETFSKWTLHAFEAGTRSTRPLVTPLVAEAAEKGGAAVKGRRGWDGDSPAEEDADEQNTPPGGDDGDDDDKDLYYSDLLFPPPTANDEDADPRYSRQGYQNQQWSGGKDRPRRRRMVYLGIHHPDPNPPP